MPSRKQLPMLEHRPTKLLSWSESKSPPKNAARNLRTAVLWTTNGNRTDSANSRLKRAANGIPRNAKRITTLAEAAVNSDVVCMVASLDTHDETLMQHLRRTVLANS